MKDAQRGQREIERGRESGEPWSEDGGGGVEDQEENQ